MRSTALLGSLIAGFGAWPGTAAPKDPCTLLKAAEIQALAPKATIGAGVKSDIGGSLGFACVYKWETGDKAAPDVFQLQVTVSEASKVYAGTSPDVITEGLLLQAKPGTPNAAVIPGVGQAAIWQSSSSIRSTTTAFGKGIILQVYYEGRDGRAKKDQVIALLKAAAARL